MNLRDFNYYNYNPQSELPGGEYWQLLDIDNGTFKAQIFIPGLCNLIKRIQNKDLKDNLKQKLVHSLNLESTFWHYLDKDIFTQDELINLFDSSLKTRLNNYSLPIHTYNLNNAISLIQNLNNYEWQLSSTQKVFELMDEQYPENDLNKYKLITELLLTIRNTTIRTHFQKKYSDILPENFSYLINVDTDKEYISKKAKNFESTQIGINPLLEIGTELELNHKLFGTFTGGFDLMSQKNCMGYRSSTDATVPNGREFITPVFHDTPEELSIFCAVCETLKELGYKATDINVAGQINIGIDYLDTAESLLQFVELYSNVEELLFHICNPEGTMMRQPVYVNSRFKAISGAIGTRTISEDITREEVLEMLSPNKSSTLPGIMYKKNSVCLRDKNRFEFRMPNGSEDYQVWIDNIRLFAKIIETSKEISDVVENKDYNEKAIEKLELKESLKDKDLTLEEKLFILMDILFDDDETKQIYVNRFYTLESEIQKTGTDLYSPYASGYQSGFDVVHFERVYNHVQKVISIDGTVTPPKANTKKPLENYYDEYGY